MIDDCNINNLAKNQVSAVFHSRAIPRSMSPKFIELFTEGHRHGDRNVPKASLIDMKIFTLELRHIEINVSSSVSTV